jgi:hypothetical protein
VVCVFAGVRVFLGAAAMPPFNDVDEQAHFDLIQKFARGYWPGEEMEKVDAGTARLRVYYGTWEFSRATSGLLSEPVWKWPAGPQKDQWVATAVESIQRTAVNHEAHSPPVYYALAACWCRLGKFLGLSQGYLFYWVRFFDVPLAVGLVLATFWFCVAFAARLVYTAPLLLACVPSPTFYSITSDVLSPLLVLLAVFALLRWDQHRTLAWSIGGGLLVAATLLVKLTNVPILVVLAFILVHRVRVALREAHGAREWLCILLVSVSASIPLIAWGARNQVVLGDWSGNDAKVRSLGWSRKPLGALADHPLFTVLGQREFWPRLIVSAWRGDVSWPGCPVESDAVNFLLLCLSVALFAAGAVAALTGWGAIMKQLPAVLLVVFVLFSVLTLMILSLLFDFGSCLYPSRAFPYFANARLISGCLGPFLILAATGVEVVSGSRQLYRWVLIGGYCLLLLASYALLVEPMSRSVFNWFHLSG